MQRGELDAEEAALLIRAGGSPLTDLQAPSSVLPSNGTSPSAPYDGRERPAISAVSHTPHARAGRDHRNQRVRGAGGQARPAVGRPRHVRV